MSNITKLSTFHQLSLNCESPHPGHRRRSLKKQFSEDIPDTSRDWLDSGVGIKISLNMKSRKNLDRPPPIKIAWDETIKAEDAVIVKKCKEQRRPTTGKITRHNSLEKDSILYSKQELTERLKQVLKDKEPTKPNLNIFLTQNSKEIYDEDFCKSQTTGNLIHETSYLEKVDRPKIMQPLFAPTSYNKNLFHLRKNAKPQNNPSEIVYSPTRKNEKNTPVIVIPIIEKETPTKTDWKNYKNDYHDEKELSDNIMDTPKQFIEIGEAPKPIDNIIIRPTTAASRRELFKKRTNSAFHSIIRESVPNSRPPLVRSSSAPTKPEGKSKFIATKRKLKASKKVHLKNRTIEAENDDIESNPKNQKERNRSVMVNGVDIVTMVSLVSPAASDNDETIEEEKEKNKSKSRNVSPNKNSHKKEEDFQKNLSLRKTVKSVSFQQSSIHAIRSFSASFPGRRASMATTLMLTNHIKSNVQPQKIHEKRSTNSVAPDDDERVPKRRLVGGQDGSGSSKSSESIDDQGVSSSQLQEIQASEEMNFSVDIKVKKADEIQETRIKNSEPQQNVSWNENLNETEKPNDKRANEVGFETDKEKQCWDMFCKMSEKGVNVSYDTILRGLLTPTEYRMRRKSTVSTPTDNC